MKTILVADEDNRIRNIVRLLFTEDRGYRVVATKSGKDAIIKAKKIKPDIVLVDVFLPDKDGYEVSREIKRTHFSESHPSSCSTAHLHHSTRKKLERLLQMVS